MKLTMATLALAGLVAAAPVADSTRDIALPAAVPSCAVSPFLPSPHPLQPLSPTQPPTRQKQQL